MLAFLSSDRCCGSCWRCPGSFGVCSPPGAVASGRGRVHPETPTRLREGIPLGVVRQGAPLRGCSVAPGALRVRAGQFASSTERSTQAHAFRGLIAASLLVFRRPRHEIRGVRDRALVYVTEGRKQHISGSVFFLDRMPAASRARGRGDGQHLAASVRGRPRADASTGVVDGGAGRRFVGAGAIRVR